jgi:hypothetical protein
MLRQLSRSSDTRREYPAGPSVHFTASSCFRLLLHRIAALFDIRSFHKNAPSPAARQNTTLLERFPWQAGGVCCRFPVFDIPEEREAL